MRNISFSRTYPSYHPNKGQPTFFPEKILLSQGLSVLDPLHSIFISSLDPKYHTIRAGHRWNVGDWFQPVYWGDDINPKSGRSGPYHSKQVKFAPPIQVKKVWDIATVNTVIWVANQSIDTLDIYNENPLLLEIAKNDGLSLDDLLDWLKHPHDFDGQIICWNENVNY